jgi:hypothetical protein
LAWRSSSLSLLGVEVFISEPSSSVSSHHRRAKDFSFQSCWSSGMLP